MKTGNRFVVCSAFLAVGLVGWDARPVAAELSDACRDLAGRFTSASAEMGPRSLAALMLCVSTEIGERLGVAMVVPSAAPGEETASPPPAPESGPPAGPAPRRPYGEWPGGAPWGGEWPEASWDQ